MTPKEKAKDLFDKFFHYASLKEVEFYSNDELAKNCALTAVSELILYSNILEIYYWKEVKKEIEKL